MRSIFIYNVGIFLINWRLKILKILVTGATGFIGSHLVEALKFDAEIISLGRQGLKKKQNNLSSLFEVDFNCLDEIRPYFRDVDVVVHLSGNADAGSSTVNPLSFFADNTLSTATILEASRVEGVSGFIFASTSGLYGTNQVKLSSEHDLLFSGNPYLASKECAEKWIESYGNSYDLSTVVMRLFNVYGPGQLKRTIVPKLIYQKLSGNKIVDGNLNVWKDYVYIEDVVKVIKIIIHSIINNKNTKLSQVINIGTGQSYSIESILNYLNTGEMLNIDKPEFEYDRDTNYACADISLLKKYYGDIRFTSIENGLNQTLAWGLKNYKDLEILFR